MDGVLIFSEAAHIYSFQETAFNILGKKLTEIDYKEYFMGKTDELGWRIYCEKFGISSNIEILVQEVGRVYANIFNSQVEINWSLVELLKYFAGLGYAVAITSSSTRNEVNMTIRHLKLDNILATSVSSDDVKYGKPHPEPYLQTAKLLSIPVSALVAIEDSPTGLSSALNAGMKCIAVTTTHTASELSHATLIVGDLKAEDVIGLFPQCFLQNKL